MIHTVTKKIADEQHGGHADASTRCGVQSALYEDVIVKKPWGYEYLVFENEHVAIWMLQIVRKRRTSMHCHPRKRTGLILLSGDAKLHHLEGSISLSRMGVVNIEAGAFHSTEAASDLPIEPVSENGIWVMEIESPPLKEDLCRMSDAYGRAGATYEGFDHMVPHPTEILSLREPEEGETHLRRTFQNLVFTVRRGAIRRDRNCPSPESLVVVIGRDVSREYTNPFLEIGQVSSFAQFQENTKGECFEGVTVLTIEQEKKVMKISDYIASTIADLGIRHVFGVCGGGAMHLVDSFGSSDRMEYIATHHEQAAAMAAEGYARISGVPGATLVTSGPGGTNAITGVYGAWVDSIPAIFVSGQVTCDTLIGDTGLRQFGIQEGNIIDIVRSITKYAVTITDPTTIRYHVEKACHLATTGRPGPVWIDVPLDIQNKLINPEELRGFTPEGFSSCRTDSVLNSLVAQCTDMLVQAQRPVLIYGYGVRLARAEDSLRNLIQRLQIPCVSSWTASDIIPTDNENYVGRSGIMGDRAGNFAVQNADLLLIVGSRMSIPQVGYNYKLFARGARKIMVDIDEIELKKPSLRPDLPICADAGRFLQALLAKVEAMGILLTIDPWRMRCRNWKGKYPVCLPEYRDNRNKVNSFYFVDRLSEKLGSDAVVVTDMGASFTCTMQTFRTKAGQRLFTSSGFSSMGFGLPGAIGACFAQGRRKTILITGDGGLQMNIQELQTVVHHRLPLIIFVLNNEGYLTIKLMQQNHFGRYIGSDPSSGLTCPDIVKLAEAYGIEAERIGDQTMLDQRFSAVLAHPGPYVCEIMMPPEQPLIPRVSSLKLPDGRIVSKPMEDLYPFLNREEFRENMIVDPVEILNH
ncbi:MAG: thiamine pyrophosphate-binding protein [Phycisphaerae bacterium]|nr:thiamine pyrophosphate-binding protein [Phycisphaerae bacterium]